MKQKKHKNLVKTTFCTLNFLILHKKQHLSRYFKRGLISELKENLKGRIGIVISHRFSTVRIADRIAVIDDGRVTELGTHEELLAAGNRYAQLFELQASGYR